jgi:hypothetical protein
MKLPLYKQIASTLQRLNRCKDSSKAEAELASLIGKLPSGGGIDNGVKLSDKSKPDKLIFTFGFHFMNDAGYYTNWGDYKLVITPSLEYDFNMRIYGKNKGGIVDYFYDIFDQDLRQEVE